MRVVFIEEASHEFFAASDYYEAQERGLGERFEEEVDRAIHWLSENPEALQLRHGIYRRLNLHIFPYYLPFVIRGSTLWVVAVAHHRRKPEYWIRRTKQTEK